MTKSGIGAVLKVRRTSGRATTVTTTTTTRTEATRDRIVPVGDKSCRIVLRWCISNTGKKIRQRKTETKRRSERDDGWRARDRAREIKKVDNNAFGAPLIPWYRAAGAAGSRYIVLPLYLGAEIGEYAAEGWIRARLRWAERPRKKGLAREARTERVRRGRQW